MNLFLTQSPQIGAAKAYLLRQALSMAAKKANHTVVEQAKEADLVIVFGSSLPNSAELVGKKVFLANEDAAIASPEVTLTNALNQAVDYVQSDSKCGWIWRRFWRQKYCRGYSLPDGGCAYLYVC